MSQIQVNKAVHLMITLSSFRVPPRHDDSQEFRCTKLVVAEFARIQTHRKHGNLSFCKPSYQEIDVPEIDVLKLVQEMNTHHIAPPPREFVKKKLKKICDQPGLRLFLI